MAFNRSLVYSPSIRESDFAKYVRRNYPNEEIANGLGGKAATNSYCFGKDSFHELKFGTVSGFILLLGLLAECPCLLLSVFRKLIYVIHAKSHSEHVYTYAN